MTLSVTSTKGLPIKRLRNKFRSLLLNRKSIFFPSQPNNIIVDTPATTEEKVITLKLKNSSIDDGFSNKLEYKSVN